MSSTSYTLISTPSSCLFGLGGRSFQREADLWGEHDGSELARDGGALRLRLEPVKLMQNKNIYFHKLMQNMNIYICFHKLGKI